VPNCTRNPSINVEYTIPDPQRVQYARAKGTPVMTSLAISCLFMMRRGYAWCWPLMDTPPQTTYSILIFVFTPS